MTQPSQPDRPPVVPAALDPVENPSLTAELDQLAAETQGWLALSPAEALARLTTAHSQVHAALAGLDRI